MENGEKKKILKFILSSEVPVETVEVCKNFKEMSYKKVSFRLHLLASEGLIGMKNVGSGKGTYIWFKKSNR